MNDGPNGHLGERARVLRQAFDQGFSQPAGRDDAPRETLLAIRLRGQPHALRLADVGRLLRVPALVRTPCAAPAWLGLAGAGGHVLPVYDLAALAGYPPPEADAAPPGWMAACSVAPVALAFDAFDGLFAHAPGARDADLLQVGGEARRLVSLAAILETIQSLARHGAAPQET